MQKKLSYDIAQDLYRAGFRAIQSVERVGSIAVFDIPELIDLLPPVLCRNWQDKPCRSNAIDAVEYRLTIEKGRFVAYTYANYIYPGTFVEVNADTPLVDALGTLLLALVQAGIVQPQPTQTT